MRDHGVISPRFWIGSTGRALRGNAEAQIVAMYLMTSPHANMIGLYYLPLQFVAHETGLDIKGVRRGFEGASKGGFAEYDPVEEIVYVPRMVLHQVDDSLKESDNRVKSIARMLGQYQGHPFARKFFSDHAVAFHLHTCGDLIDIAKLGSPFEAPSKPLRSQDQGQDQEQGLRLDANASLSSPADAGASTVPVEPDQAIAITSEPAPKPKPPASAAVVEVFDHWRSVMRHPSAKLTDKRKRNVENRLRDGFTVADLKRAVDGCKLSPHHMGVNDTGTVYDDLELICRDGERVERFVGYADKGGPIGRNLGSGKGSAVAAGAARLLGLDRPEEEYFDASTLLDSGGHAAVSSPVQHGMGSGGRGPSCEGGGIAWGDRTA